MNIRRRTLLTGALASLGGTLWTRASSAAAYEAQVSPTLLPVAQGPADLCWLAATAVAFGWKEQVGGSLADSERRMADAANRLGGEFTVKYLTKSALEYSALPLWKSRGGFQSQAQQCLDASGWKNLLTQHGPLITLVDGTGSGAINHAVVVGGISGDGSAEGTTLTYADGATGTIQARSLSDFTAQFELPPGDDALFSVMYLDA